MTLHDDEDSKWHLDKKVPISIIVAMFMQFGGGIWFLSRLEGRVVALEADKAAQHILDERQDQSRSEALSLIRSDVRDVGAKVDRLIEKAYSK